MDAAGYLEQLIAHLIAGMRSGDDIDGSGVLHTVEGAATALAAAGLLDAGDVGRSRQHALDALEASGAIEQITFSSSESFSAAALGPDHDRLPAPAPPREDPPALTGVVPIAQRVAMADGGALSLLSINRWTTGFDLFYATAGRLRGLRDDGPLDWNWALTDDHGMQYAVRRGGGGGGGGAITWMRLHAVPALPADARHLTIAAARVGAPLLTTTADLTATVWT